MGNEPKIGVGVNLTIQIVNFKSRHYLRKCLFSISQYLPGGIDAEVLVVNNDEEPLGADLEELSGKLNLQILEQRKNSGFGSAHNAGFRRSQGDYILFLNPDTEFLPGALEKLLKVFSQDEKVGIAGPLLVDSLGQAEPDCFGTSRTPLSTIKRKITGRKDRHQVRRGEIFESDWVSGGAMLARRDVFEKAGGFDENYFMYFEDVDLCLRAKKMGYKIMVNPSVKIFHASGKSFASEREKKKYYYDSQDYYFRKHFGRAGAAIVRLFRLPYYAKNVWLNS